jgi:hypothetical protein
MNALVNDKTFGEIITDYSTGTVTLKHDRLDDVSLFADRGSLQKIALKDSKDRPTNYFGLENTVTGELIDSPPVSRGYKLVDHALAFQHQAKTILGNPDLPHGNFTVVDKIIEGGRKATRAIYFNDLTWDIDGRGQGVTARADLINSIDMSSAFQIFAGAYREYCENTCVFGGAKTYHQKRKHTRNLSPEAMIAKAILSMAMFEHNRDQMNHWRTINLDPSQWVEIMENTLCKKGGAGSALSTDKKARVNGKLLDYMMYRFREEQRELGSTLWAGYNALTHWATHTDETFERVSDDGKVTTLQTGRSGSNRDLVQMQRQADVRKVLESPEWMTLEGTLAA